MTQALIYIRVAAQPNLAYEVPLLKAIKQRQPSLITFEFDNFSEETIRQYAAALVEQSSRVAVVAEVQEAKASIAGLTTYFNRVLKAKPESVLLILQGEQPILQKMMQTIAGNQFYHNLPAEKLEEVLQAFFNAS